MTIPRRSGSGDAPLSSNQLRLWYLEQLEHAPGVHNLAVAFRMRGTLDPQTLERAIQAVHRRHEALRTQIVDLGGEPVQRVHRREPTLTRLDGLATEGTELALGKRLQDFASQPIPIDDADLVRWAVQETGPDEWALVVVAHHAVFDGWSLNLVLDELAREYRALTSDDGSAVIGDPPLQYADFATWQREGLDSPGIERQVGFWMRHLEMPLPVLDLMTDRPRPAVQSFDGAAVRAVLPDAFLRSVMRLAREERATGFMVLLTAYFAVLHLQTGQEDIVVGTPIAGRYRPETHRTVGFFANTLALRADFSDAPSFRELLRQVRNTCLDAFENQEVPFEALVRRLRPTRDLSRTPIYQTMFGYEETEGRTLDVAALDVRPMSLPVERAITDVSFWIEVRPDGAELVAEYATALFDRSTVDDLVRHFQSLAQAGVDDPDRALQALPTSGPSGLGRIDSWNATDLPVPQDRGLASWLTEVWASRTRSTALIAGDDRLTYGELEARANRLAHHLIGHGVRPGTLVGICLERTTDMVVAVLAVWKAGAGYVPLDPHFPPTRLGLMADRAKLELVVTVDDLRGLVPDFGGHHVCLDRNQDLWREAAPSTPVLEATPTDPAYVLFTSGSTGEPKGVRVPQSCVINFLEGMAQRPGLTPDDVLLAVTTLSFDISILELFLPLRVGGTLVLASSNDVMDGSALAGLMHRHGVTTMQATPSSWRLLLAAGWQGHADLRALCGGEAFPKDLLGKLLLLVGEVWNMYGPTETTVWSTCAQLTDPDAPIVIGQPIANTQCHVLDREGRRVPPGAPGELFIGGLGVADVYLGRSEETERSFVPDPFSSRSGARMYRTGDTVRWRRNGDLEYLHRADRQVKLRGFRIELGEVEVALAAAEDVSASTVVLADSGGSVELIGYVEADAAVWNERSARGKLAERLPPYMIPRYLVRLDQLPLTDNGKVDKNALPEPGAVPVDAPANGLAPPETDDERYFLQVWQEALELPDISVHDNFFDLGGHSLLALEVVSRVRADRGADVPLRAMIVGTLRAVAGEYLRPAAAGAVTEAVGDGSGMSRLWKRARGWVSGNGGGADSPEG
jgi:amino acid adenylation domain-containing protein